MLNNPLFIDTSFTYAIINPNDQWHKKAVEWQQRIVSERLELLTTQFILTEIADGLSSLKFRRQAVSAIQILENSDFIEIIPATSELFRKGLNLYESRPDKSWGLTDCVSFVVMNEKNLFEALTTDDHFRQAGFRALMLENE